MIQILEDFFFLNYKKKIYFLFSFGFGFRFKLDEFFFKILFFGFSLRFKLEYFFNKFFFLDLASDSVSGACLNLFFIKKN